MGARGDQLQRGSVVAGYRIDELISRGGMGLVYRATNMALRRIYALKILAPELAEDEQFRRRFQREMRIAASLHHPNIVGIHYAGEHEGLLYFVMDYVTGTDLREVLLQYGPLEPTRAVDLLEQLASALDTSHRRGLVHRDVKPANVLITVKDGEEHAYLTDFGLARKFDTASSLTAKGLVVGTVDYMAPEQITGNHTDARADLYALGCVFYQMLTGRVPYERNNSVATLLAHVHEPPPPLEGAVADNHPALVAVLEKAMAKDPSDRYLSVGDYARGAAAALRGLRDTAPATIVGTGEAMPIVESEDATKRAARHEATPSDEPGEATELAQGSESIAPMESAQGTEFIAPMESAQGSEFIAPAGLGAPATEADVSVSQPAPVMEADVIVPEPAPATETEITVSPPSRQDVPAIAAREDTTSIPAEEARHAPSADPTTPASTATPPEAPAGDPPMTEPDVGRGAAMGPSREREVEPALSPAADDGATTARPARRSRNRYLLPGVGAVLLIAAAVVAVIVLTSGGSSTPPGQPFTAVAQPVPTNRVTGGGTATLVLQGDTVTATVHVHGLIGQPHAMHIHAGGLGVCPPASAARLHNGHLSISTGNGIKFYGPPQVSLTTSGDTSPKSIVDFSRYPTTGIFDYKRAFTVPAGVAAAIRAHDAVFVVHGINYDNTGFYDDFLGPSDLDSKLPGEATAPALCGTLEPSQTASASRLGATSFTVVLRPATVVTAAQATSFSLLCHIPPVAASAATPPRA